MKSFQSSKFTRQETAVRWGIVIAGAVVNSIILLAPAFDRSPAVSQAATIDTAIPAALSPQMLQQIQRYQQQLHHSHTAETHLKLANLLSGVGQRDAAMQQYELALSHSTAVHTDVPQP